MGRNSLSRRALLRVGGLGVVGLTGCLFGREEGASNAGTDPSTAGRTRTRTPTETVRPTATETTETARPTDSTDSPEPTEEPTTERSPTEERTDEPTTENTTAEETSREPTDDPDDETTSEELDEEDTEDRPDLCTADPRIDGSDPLLVDRNSRELRKCAGRPFDAFEDLADWEPSDGSMHAVDGSFVGSQSAGLTATDGSVAAISRQFPDGIDLADRDLSLAVDLDAPETERIEITLLAPDEDNALVYERKIRAAGWYRLDCGPTDIQGSPDLSDVRELTVSVDSRTGSLQMAIDSLRTTDRAERGAVMLTFDDNLLSQYETAFPITETYGFPGTVGVIPHKIGNDSTTPVDDMTEMHEAGWEMVSHPQHADPLPEMSHEAMTDAIVESKTWLVENGFEEGAQYMIWPFNKYDADCLDVASRYHRLGFAMSDCPIGRQVTGPLSVGRVNGDEVAESKTMIDRAAAYNDLVVVMYHTIGTSGSRISEHAFREVMAHIDRADVDVITPSDLWDSIAG